MMPLERYQQAIASGQFTPDPLQAMAMEKLQTLYTACVEKKRAWWKCVLWKQSKKSIKGLYFWGSVGIGKTWLMDLFYESLPTAMKQRMHFHRFMRQVHHELTQLQGRHNPLKEVARRFAKKSCIICLDEFFVSDIGDAMLLGNLLEALFAEGVTLITTSNSPPELLYRNGLQRDRFLPAIALLNQYTEVVHMDTRTDYRLRILEQAGTYFFPLNYSTEQSMQQNFMHFAYAEGEQGTALLVEGREIPTIRCAAEVVWFDFHILCNVPRSQIDYLEIARNYPTVLLSDVPQLTAAQENQVYYFINLVDVFYDARVKLIISAEVPIEEIYREGRFSFEFQRTRSRLLEMQSRAYLSEPHKG